MSSGAPSRIPGPSHGAANVSFVGDTGHLVDIEQVAHRGLIVRVTYPEARRRNEIKVLRIISLSTALAVTIAWLFLYKNLIGAFTAFAISATATWILTNMVRSFSAITRSYIFQADNAGLSVETSRGRKQTKEFFARNQILEVGLGFSFYRGPNSLFKSWLSVTATNWEFQYLQDLGGDHLAKIANAIRAALGMPPRSWP